MMRYHVSLPSSEGVRSWISEHKSAMLLRFRVAMLRL